MGTSAARRAPTTRLWRRAKGSATRYLSYEGGAVATAGEVTARYLAALSESHESQLAAFRLTRKLAQDLGARLSQAALQGWREALQAWGLGELAAAPPEVWGQALSAAVAGADGGLEAAVARVSLASVVGESLRAPAPSPLEPASWVRDFLAAAVHLRLNLDLGESLEAAGAGYGELQQGLAVLRTRIEQAAPAMVPGYPRDPEAWRGLPGWTWVTRVLELLIANLSNLEPGT
jgi:hypothetical protein